ncbi:hypothetical protein JW930_02000 [Candidatus Woesearchaeota archaeon]|nr:hypothetical protein [Candidatus Woesearchaeota archaeon]
MAVPSIRIKTGNPRIDAQCLYRYYPDYWEGIIDHLWPKLEHLTGSRRKDLRYLKGFMEGQYALFKGELEAFAQELQTRWDKIHEPFMSELEHILDIKWSRGRISGYVSLAPGNPRNIQSREFVLDYRQNIEAAIQACAHEIIHFLFFRKWKQIFPDHDPAQYDRPALAWHLSELFVVLMLNEPSISQLVLTQRAEYEGPYRFYERAMIGDKSVAEHFGGLYRQHRGDMKALLEQAYADALEYARVFEGFR